MDKESMQQLKQKIEQNREKYEAKYRETPCIFAGNKRSGCVVCKGLRYDKIDECEAFWFGREMQIARDENRSDSPW